MQMFVKVDKQVPIHCTLFMGIAGDEALPYLVIVPSSASSTGQVQLSADMIIGQHQIYGRYGLQHR